MHNEFRKGLPPQKQNLAHLRNGYLPSSRTVQLNTVVVADKERSVDFAFSW